MTDRRVSDAVFRLCHRRLVTGGDGAEIVLESARRAQQQEAHRLCLGIGERVRDRSGHERERTRLEPTDLVAGPDGEMPLEHEEHLVKPRMDVLGRTRKAGGSGVFDDGLPLAGDLDHEAVAADGEQFTLAGSEHGCSGLGGRDVCGYGGCVHHAGQLGPGDGHGQSQESGIVAPDGGCDDGRVRGIRELERLVGERPDAEELYTALVELLRSDGLRFDGACWHVNDPLTGLFARTGVIGELPGDYRIAIELELWRDDVAKLDELAQRPVPVASLVDETGGHPESSPRWQEMIRPDGQLDELRVAFVDPFGRWGSVAFFRADTPFEQSDRDRLAATVPLVAQALRIGTPRGAVPDAPVPGVIVVDRADALEAIDPTARRLLHISDNGSELPGTVHIITACARRAAAPQRARMQSAEGWILLDATPLDGDSGRVAVVAQPAPSASLVDLRLLAAGLSAREREVALCVIRGESTRQIATSLHVSSWTVQDHLKAVFEKTSVRSRRELIAQLVT